MVRKPATSAGGNFAVAWPEGTGAAAGAAVEATADWPELAPLGVAVAGEVELVLHPETKTLQDRNAAIIPVLTLIFATMLNTFPCVNDLNPRDSLLYCSAVDSSVSVCFSAAGSGAGARTALRLLPIIIVGQNIQAKASDARAQATYDDASAVLDKATQIQSHLLAIQQHLEDQDGQILAILTRVMDRPDSAGH